MIKKPLIYARELISHVLKPGGVAVDATCGNGHDTVFLAQLAGPQGRVYAFDIQPSAIVATKERLVGEGLLGHVSLFQETHANLNRFVNEPVDAAMFNLGYLPGGDHHVVTQPATTVAALRQLMEKLKKGGIITLVVYTGHAGGTEEFSAVFQYLRALPQQEFSVLQYGLINQVNHPPLLLAVSRL